MLPLLAKNGGYGIITASQKYIPWLHCRGSIGCEVNRCGICCIAWNIDLKSDINLVEGPLHKLSATP